MDNTDESIEEILRKVQEIADDVDVMNDRLENCVKQLRYTADYLDEVWWDCKLANAIGCSLSIAGGVMTSGAALPLLVAGTCTSQGANFVEKSINSSILQEADKDVQDANCAIENVKKSILELKTRKNQVQLALLVVYAVGKLGKDHLTVKLLKELVNSEMITQIPEVKEPLKAGVELGEVAAEKDTSELSTDGFSSVIGKGKTALVIINAIDLAFTVKDLVKNEGCNAARILRCKVDEYEVIRNMANKPCALNTKGIEEIVHMFHEFADSVDLMKVKVDNCIKELENAANELDKTWWKCKLANSIGCALSIIGGITTSGAALPLLLAGTGTNIGAHFVEAQAESSQVQVAEKALQNANLAIENVNQRIESLKTVKNGAHLALLVVYAVEKFGTSHRAVALLKQLLVRAASFLANSPKVKVALPTGAKLIEAAAKNVTSELATKDAGAKAAGGVGKKLAKSGKKAVKEASAKDVGSVIKGVKVAFVIFDTIDLAFTVKDLVKNKGCNAARTLRYKADEYRAIRSKLLEKK